MMRLLPETMQLLQSSWRKKKQKKNKEKKGAKMLNTTKTLKDDMLVGDLVDNHEFDINCNFEIYDCTKRGSNQASQRLTSEAVRLSAVHERGFRPACEVKTETFDPRTTFCRSEISRSQLIFTYENVKIFRENYTFL